MADNVAIHIQARKPSERQGVGHFFKEIIGDTRVAPVMVKDLRPMLVCRRLYYERSEI